jgi:hypothetical protein
MTQSQTQTPQTAVKPNALAALDKKVADGIAAEKAGPQTQPEMQAPAAAQMGAAPANDVAKVQIQQGDAAAVAAPAAVTKS